ncbi:MAG: M48 family peptidase, partial [Pseudomonadota bacterium]
MTAGFMTFVFLLFLFSKKFFELYLEYRNLQYIKAHRSEVPQTFQHKVTLDEHQKAANYSIAQIKVSTIFDSLDFLVLLLWTLGGGLNWAYQMADNCHQGPIVTGLIFFTVFGTIEFLIHFPQAIYHTFFFEEKWGHNRTTIKTFILDQFKSLLLTLVVGFPVLAGILWFMQESGICWWIYVWCFLCLIQLIMLYLYPQFIAPLFNKFTPLAEGELKGQLET